MDSKEIKTQLDRIYGIFSYGFARLGNVKASNGYRVCKLLNKYLSSSLASWFSQNIVDRFATATEWDLISNVHEFYQIEV